MFMTDPTIVDLKIRERNLYKAIFSMNFHQVAIPELGVEEARCYIFFFSEGDRFSAYIVLYIPHTGRRLYYTYSSNPFPQAELPMVEGLARTFGEEMGFFLDEKLFASSPVVEKNLWIDEQPLFGNKTPEERANAVGATETAAEPAAKQTPAPTAPAVRVDENASPVTAVPAPPTAQPPIPAASAYQQAPAQAIPPTPPATPAYYQPAPMAPVAPPIPAAPAYQQAPAQPIPPTPPVAPAYYQPAPMAPVAPPIPAAPAYQQAPAQAMPPAPPVAPVYYQPASAATVDQQAPPQPAYNNEVEIEPQVEVEGKAYVRTPRQKSTAAQRSSTEKVQTAGASPRTEQAVHSDPLEREPRATQKDLPPAPKQQIKKQTRGAVGVVGTEMEALARLVASF